MGRLRWWPASPESAQIVSLGRPLHSALEVLFPDAGPWPVVQVPHRVLDRRPRRHLRAAAVLAGEDRLVAVLEVKRRPVLVVAPAREEADVAYRLDERVRIVEHGFVLQAGEPSVGEAPRRPDLDELHLVAVLPAAVREPALEVGRPRDQGLAVPEADGLAEPTGHRRAKVGHLGGAIEIA